MKCPICGETVSEEARQCTKCGAAVSSVLKENGRRDMLATIPGAPPASFLNFSSAAGSVNTNNSSQETLPLESNAVIAGRFIIKNLLGKGGMGDVYCCLDRQLNRTVAIKRLLPKLEREEWMVQRFMVEARAVASISHNNVTQVYDIIENAEGKFIVMEYVDGETLASRIDRLGKLSIHETARIMLQIGMALDAAHRRHVVHRDIKPANIIISGAGIPKLGDFGISQLMGEQDVTSTGTAMGTWVYASPEQLVDAKHVDGRADIYSIGATMYEMLTGQIPRQIYMDRIPELMRPILEKCLAQEPDDRYQTAAEFTLSLNECYKIYKESQAAALAANVVPDRRVTTPQENPTITNLPPKPAAVPQNNAERTATLNKPVQPPPPSPPPKQGNQQVPQTVVAMKQQTVITPSAKDNVLPGNPNVTNFVPPEPSAASERPKIRPEKMTEEQKNLYDMIDDLEAKIKERKELIDRIFELIEKAETRGQKEPDKRRHWNHVQDNLETALVETRGGLGYYEQSLKDTRKELEELEKSLETGIIAQKPMDDMPELLVDDIPIQLASVDVVERLLSIPQDVMSRLSLDDVAKLHSMIMTPSDKPSPEEEMAQASPKEDETQIGRKSDIQTYRRRVIVSDNRQQQSFQERVRQKILKDAFEKLCKNKMDLMSLEEVDSVVAWHDILVRKGCKDDAEKRAKETLDRLIESLNQRSVELRRKRAKMYNKPRK